MDQNIKKDTSPCVPLETFEALERVNVAITRASTHESMLENVLDSMLDIFDCQRAWLLFPCSATAKYYRIPMERTRPEFPGAGLISQDIEGNDDTRRTCARALESDEPVVLAPDTEPADYMHMMKAAFAIDSMIVMAIHPDTDSPWLLGIHHCEGPKSYDHCTALFKAIGRRVADGLAALQATNKLRRSEQRLRILIEHAPEAIVLLDCETLQFIEANPMAEQLFGLPHTELLTAGGPAAFSPERQSDGRLTRDRVNEHITAALSGQFPVFEWDHFNAKGQLLPCEIRLAAFPDPTRKLVRASITDITHRRQTEQERQELEERLTQAQKMEAIGNLTGGLAHDFNNLLTVILGNLDLLDMTPGDPAFVGEQSQMIRAAAERAAALTHRLLAFARKQPLRPNPLNIAELVHGMDDLLRRTIGEQIEIKVVLADGLWLCEVDSTQLESTILNLAVNARDAMPLGGRLTIEASNTQLDAEYASHHEDVLEGQYVQLTVTDGGTGIAAELLPKIFAPFFSTKAPGKGTGLGLSMVYGFVKQSGGHVQAYSELEVGTVMKLYFPRILASQSKAPVQAPPITPQQGSDELVLVVEDEESVRRLTIELLKQLGYRTREASGPDQALQLLAEHPEIDLLLTDVILAGSKTGAEVSRIARQSRPDLRVLYMSGYTKDAISKNGRLDRGAHLMEKPFTKAALSIRVREALGQI